MTPLTRAEKAAKKREWHKRPPPYERFFAPLHATLTPGPQEMLHFAYTASKYGHARQKREGGTRYFDHPKAAAWIYIDELKGRDVRVIADALLHDLPEDCYLLSEYRMHLNFGQHIAEDVQSMTKYKRTKETTPQYLNRIIDQGPWPILGKLCDRLHNLRTLHACSSQKRKVQIRETKRYHLRMLIPALKKFGEPWATHSHELKEKMLEAIAVYS